MSAIFKNVIFPLLLFGAFFLLFSGHEMTPITPKAMAADYVWIDSLAATPTAIDCLFTERWVKVTLMFVGCDGWIKIGAPDTASWSSRKWHRIKQWQPVEIGPSPALKRLEYKTSTGDTGAVFMAGTKRAAMY